jgi:predicted ribosome quality control (RQC) complex YloA/Tae2 family protein
MGNWFGSTASKSDVTFGSSLDSFQSFDFKADTIKHQAEQYIQQINESLVRLEKIFADLEREVPEFDAAAIDNSPDDSIKFNSLNIEDIKLTIAEEQKMKHASGYNQWYSPQPPKFPTPNNVTEVR